MNSRRLAIVTGGARGIGFGIARALASEGFALAICGRSDETRVTSALEELRSIGSEVSYYSADIGSAEDRLRLVDAIYADFGKVDVLVNNAGVAPAERTDILEASEESYDRVMGINQKGPYFLTQEVA
ncbi:MAG: SDR family NAD(P)-dependent oxidoreductase, partial [Rhodothermales bacterium]|nr:SDR family NAD(P)-dependent oxidoreductase [Rhodothermales bacterium]